MSRPTLANGPMRYAPVTLSALGMFYLIFVNSFTYSAFADHPQVGKAFRAAVADDAPVIASYLLIGDFLRKALPSVGTETAYAAAEPLAERINAYPPAAVAVFFGEPQSSQQGRMQWQHRLMPVFLLLALLTWWRRPQNIHMVRQTRHR